MAEAITATSASPGPSSGTSTSSTCRLLRGSLSRLVMPANMSTSSLCTVTARYLAGISSAEYVSGDLSPERIASRMACIVVLLRTGGQVGTCCLRLSAGCAETLLGCKLLVSGPEGKGHLNFVPGDLAHRSAHHGQTVVDARPSFLSQVMIALSRRSSPVVHPSRVAPPARLTQPAGEGAGSTSSTRIPPASLGWMKLTRYLRDRKSTRLNSSH